MQALSFASPYESNNKYNECDNCCHAADISLSHGIEQELFTHQLPCSFRDKITVVSSEVPV